MLCTFFAAAQKEIPDFGEVSRDELLLTDCPFEPGAGAMKIFDITETELYFFPTNPNKKQKEG
ncbi:MAG: hypothetical protein IPM85_13520 [Chitinophagaceae bacterium]|nr:hypothetical protein [Chitinophagaceae bacterium]